MSKDDQKKLSAEAALKFVEDGMIVGVGTGSTVAYFIDGLARMRDRIEGAVSSSEQSTQRLRAHGIPVFDLNAVGPLQLYVDGADECDPQRCLIKGGGGALTREKIIAQASKSFVCIIDAAKQVEVLGAFPLPVEVIPMARSAVARSTPWAACRRGARAWSPTTATGSSTCTACTSTIRSPPNARTTRSPASSRSACSRCGRRMW